MSALHRLLISALLRLVVSLSIGAASGILTGIGATPSHGILVGITTTAGVFVASGFAVLWPMNASATHTASQKRTLGPRLNEISVIGASALAICVTAAILVLGGADAGYVPGLFGLLSVFLLWAGVQLLYASHYAYLYYGPDSHRGIDFGMDLAPSYREFIYFSFSIGMSSGMPGGVSLTDTRAMTAVFRHGLFSYITRTVIMAAAINVIVGVFTG